MKLTFVFALLGLSLAGCKKNVPVLPAASFDQDFPYRFADEVRLPTVENPELTVTVADLDYSICPSSAYCFVGDYVIPTLRIVDAVGQVQQLTLHQQPSEQLPCSDTTTVRANGRRYLLCFRKWSTNGKRDNVLKKDIVVTLRIVK